MDYNLKRILLKPMDIIYNLNPELGIRLMYRLQTGEALNLINPHLYNEKLQWLKLNYKNEKIPKCVDKYTVRDFVRKKGLGFTLNEIYWEGFNPEDIPFEDLPNEFVIKVTHGQGFNIICKNKSTLNQKEIISKLKKWLKTKFLPSYGEWFYGVEPPRVIVERYLTDKNNRDLQDYKIFCFNGTPKYIRVSTNRFSSPKHNVYDLDWNLMEGYSMGLPNDQHTIEKPTKLDEMLEYASRLSSEFPHVRVDFYQVGNKVFFGEMTFTSGAGFSNIKPKEFNEELGSYIKLPVESSD